jgi:ribosome-associated protein
VNQNSDFVSKNVKDIIEDKSLSYPQNMALACAWLMGNMKGVNLKVIDMQGASSLNDLSVLGSVTNIVQGQSLAGTIIRQMKLNGYLPKGSEGMNNADWILIDLGDVIIHIFLEHARSLYDLDGLWAESPTLPIPDEYYFSAPPEAESSDSESDYF